MLQSKLELKSNQGEILQAVTCKFMRDLLCFVRSLSSCHEKRRWRYVLNESSASS